MLKEEDKKTAITPFGVVLILTVFCLVMSISFGSEQNQSFLDRVVFSLQSWRSGFFGLLEFTLQMMMILVFGYCLAVFRPVHSILKQLAAIPKNQLEAVLITAFITLLSALINWGFGLIIGAVLARFMTISLDERGIRVNPGLLASAGLVGMAVWHGGLSGSAPLKVAEEGHFLMSSLGVISVSDTLFSGFNLIVTLGLIFVFLTVLIFFAKFSSEKNEIKLRPIPLKPIEPGKTGVLGMILGLVIIGLVILAFLESNSFLAVINLNFVIFLLFGITFFVYRTIPQFTEAVGAGIKSSVDIFIQFPFYAGILGILSSSGLIDRFSDFILSSSEVGLAPYFTLTSAALVNLLIPSGGGQWAIQGPILAKTALAAGLPLGKMVMLFSYGDQISNLLQPFWALPLLAITGVPVRNLIKYCLGLFIAGFAFLILAIFLFF